MARPRLDKNKISEIQRLRGRGHSIDKIEDAMDAADMHVSRGAIHRVVKKWEELPEAIRMADSSVDWHSIEDHGLPWESLRFLLEIWSLTLGESDATYHGSLPSVRQVLWWWRIHQVVPDAPSHVIRWIAGDFASIERLHDTSGWDLDYSDLWAYLSFAPWSGAKNQEAYDLAVEEQRVPARNYGISVSELNKVRIMGERLKHQPMDKEQLS